MNDTLDQMDLIDIYRNFDPKEAKYTFFSNAHGTFSKIDHIIRHKTSLDNFKTIEITSSIFSDNKGLKLETNLKEKNSKTLKFGRLNSMLLNNEWVNNEIKEEIKKFLETNDSSMIFVKNIPSKWKYAKKKKDEVAILISNRYNLKKAIKRDPEGHFIILKGRIHKEDINITNIYAPNAGAPKYLRKILEDFKKDIDSYSIIYTRGF